MTQAHTELRALAEAAEKDGQHIFTNPRDSNAWKANEAWHKAAAPEVVIALLNQIAQLEQAKCLHQIAEPAASVEKQIEEVMGLADAFVEATQANGAWFYNDKTNTARNAIDEKLRTLLCSSQSVEQVPFMYAIADGYGNAFFEEQGCVSSEAKDLQPEVDALNENLDGEPPYKVVAVYTHPAPALEVSQAAHAVIAERARQISAEGYTPEQDDGYTPGVLALHGGLYACHAYDNLAKKRAPEGWQWDEKWWKPKDPRRNLVKAGALVLAEIERMDRSFAAQAKQGGA